MERFEVEEKVTKLAISSNFAKNLEYNEVLTKYPTSI